MDANYHFWGNGDRKDVSLSYEDYLDLVYILHDDKLSPKMLLRFKNLHEVNIYGMSFVPIYCFPVAYGLTRLILGAANRAHSGYRNFWTLMSVTLPITCWVGYTLPIPRRLYTDILTARDQDGTYIRQRIKQTKPGFWRKLSKQLFEKNYKFPEMNEITDNTEFPLDYVAPHRF